MNNHENSRVIYAKTDIELKQILENSPNLILVDFFATWCNPCKQISPHLDKLSINYPNITIIKVDVDKLKYSAQYYGISAMPSFQFFSNQGQKINELIRGANLPLIIKTIKKNDKLLNSKQYKDLGNFYLKKIKNLNEAKHWYDISIQIIMNNKTGNGNRSQGNGNEGNGGNEEREEVVLTNRSLVNLNLGNYIESLKDAEKAVSINKKYYKSSLRLIEILLKLSKFNKIFKIIQNLKQDLSNSSESSSNSSNSSSETKIIMNKLNQFEKTIQKIRNDNQNKELSNLDKEKGNKYFKSNDLKKAIVYYSSAIQLFINNHVLWSNRAMAFLKLNQIELALEDINYCLEINKDFEKAITLKNRILTQLKK